MEWIVLIVVVGIALLAVFALFARTTALLVGLAVNAIVGLILLFLTLVPDKPGCFSSYSYQPPYHTYLRYQRCGWVVDHPGAPSAADSFLGSRNSALYFLRGKPPPVSENASSRQLVNRGPDPLPLGPGLRALFPMTQRVVTRNTRHTHYGA